MAEFSRIDRLKFLLLFLLVVVCFLCFITLVFPGLSRADTIKLAWDPYDLVNNGDVRVIRIYKGTASKTYDETVDAPCTVDSCVNEYELDLFDPATYFFAVTAVDKDGNESDYSNEVSYTVKPPDITPPVFAALPDVAVDATDANGAAVEFEVTATDDSGETPVVSCVPESGSLFPIGETSVQCFASDGSGNLTSGVFKVTVRDVIPPEPPVNLRVLIAQAIDLLNQVLELLPQDTDDPEDSDVRQEVTVISPVGYQTGQLQVGDIYLLDRVYTLVAVPEEISGVWVLPKNGDKNVVAEDFLQLDISAPATIYVAYDNRAVHVPDWLADFIPTGLRIDVSDADMGYFSVFEKQFPAGRVVLGGNKATGAEYPLGTEGATYLVIVAT